MLVALSLNAVYEIFDLFRHSFLRGYHINCLTIASTSVIPAKAVTQTYLTGPRPAVTPGMRGRGYNYAENLQMSLLLLDC